MAKRRADQLLVDRGLAESSGEGAGADHRRRWSTVDWPARRQARHGPLPRMRRSTVAGPRPSLGVARRPQAGARASTISRIRVAGAVALDIGASTGGFTDVLLAHGAARVHAVDVGRGQLAWKLRQDPRVVVHEGINARYLTRRADPGPDRPRRLRCQLYRPGDRAAGAPRRWPPERARPGRADQAAIRGRTRNRSARAASCAIRRFTAWYASACRPGSRRNPAGALSALSRARCRGRPAIANS